MIDNTELVMSVDFFAQSEAKKAWRQNGSWADLDDFVQAARLGVAIAAQTFDASQGALTTWSHYQIRKQLQELQKQAIPTYVPSRAYAEMTKDERRWHFKSTAYLSDPIKSSSDDTVLEHVLPDHDQDNAADRHERRYSLRILVQKALKASSITPRERQVLDWVYGLTGQPAMEQTDVAVHLGVTKQRTGQVMAAAHVKVRRSLLRLAGCEASLQAFL